MKQPTPVVQIMPLFRCHISYDCHPQAGECYCDWPEWDGLNNLVYCAAQEADPTDHNAEIEHFTGGAACPPYIAITCQTWGDCKSISDAVIRCIIDNGGIVERQRKRNQRLKII